MQEQCIPPSRRSVLRLGARAAVIGLAGSAIPSRVFAASGRAAVCIYLFGGNDSNNMLVPLDQYSSYQNARGPIAIPRNSLLPVTGAVSGREFGFHPAMAEAAELFGSSTVGVVANVGRLRKVPANPGEARSMFQSLSAVDKSLRYAQGGYATPGWAGDGDITTGFPNGRGTTLVGPSAQRGPAQDRALEFGSSAARRLGTRFPATGIGQQLKQIAGMLSGGLDGQTFLVPLNGFATPVNQLVKQGLLLGQLSEAMGAFYRSTQEIGISSEVVTYTDTEYSRALVPNGKGGTERGWGGHHLVMGGSVMGGEVYGDFPALAAGGPEDVTGTGVWLPAISRQRFTSTLAAWMGLPDVNPGAAPLRFLA
jgi:uncharacterized protein (DUF1501 family)